MKLAICFTVFDSLELLDKAIESALTWCDQVVIAYQKISFTGQPAGDELYATLMDLQDKYTARVVLVLEYKLDSTVGPKANERNKHNMMIACARAGGATHFVMAATDHFYRTEEVEEAKKIILDRDYDVTFTGMFTYYKWPTWQISPVETYFMPFICKVTEETRVEKTKGYPVYVDPSVQVVPLRNGFKFDAGQIMLHHYSMVRLDVVEKFKNAASQWSQEEIARFKHEYDTYNLEENPGIHYFQGRKILEVADFFGLNSIFDPSLITKTLSS